MPLHEVFSEMLVPRNVRTVFQPIVDIRGGGARLHSVECLTRTPAEVSNVSPQDLFDHARQVGAEGLLDRSCMFAALCAAASLAGDFRVSVNVHASTLAADSEFPSFIAEASETSGIALSRLTIEIVEHSPPHGVKAFRTALAKLRELGMLVAIDDIGLGYSNFRMIVDAQADYFKIDRYFVSGIERDPYRFAVLESVAKLAGKVDARVIAEGIETATELGFVIEAGIDLVQGFYFSEPLPPEGLRNLTLFQESQTPRLRSHSAPRVNLQSIQR
jgi:EAL domain-containing protein (putative c-di-GMP-specific phosphodiesterase class I)